MSRRARHGGATPAWVLAAALALLAATLAGCPGRAGEESAKAVDPARQRVLDFWQRQNAATEARTRRDFAEAARLYEEALALQPRHEDALYYLGQCRRELSDPRAARVAFERLVEANPASARGHLALGALLASPDAQEPMDLAQAERHLQRAHAINGEETGPVVRLGEIALVTGRMDDARHWFESALRSNPKSIEAAFLAGYVGWEAGRATAPLVARVQAAAKVEAPVKGVLSEGDRRDTQRVAAPPLANPVGRLLFGEPIDRLRAQGTEGKPVSEAALVEDWRAVRGLRRDYHGRAGARP